MMSFLQYVTILYYRGFPCSSVSKESTCNAGDPGWEDPLEKETASTPVFLPGKSYRQRSLVVYSPQGPKSQT